jgi:hypothetical protein
MGPQLETCVKDLDNAVRDAELRLSRLASAVNVASGRAATLLANAPEDEGWSSLQYLATGALLGWLLPAAAAVAIWLIFFKGH